MGNKKIVMTLSNPFKVDPRVYKEARTLVKYGYEVTILAWDREGIHSENEEIEGIHVKRIRVRSRYGSILSFLVSLPVFYLKALSSLLKMDFDVIHTHDFDTAFLGAVLKLLRKKKWVYDIHDIYFTRISLLKEKSSHGFIQRFLHFLEVTFAKWADIVIVVTKSMGGSHEGFKEFYVSSGVLPNKIKVVWNTPMHSMFSHYPRLNLKKSNRLTVGYIGSIRTVSNFVPLFEVARKRGYKLLFVGGGKSQRDVEKLAKNYPEVEVEFTGNVPYELIPNYYNLCDVLYSYFPPTENVKRTITVKVFESAFLGVPSIVNGDSLMEDFVTIYRCGVPLEGLTPEKLERAIEKAKDLKFSVRPFREKWVWERQEKKIIKIYKQVVE
ncbi:glycosyltransferase family 4 protein [Thermococcus sp. MAR1]|uniref:glycosyltransferase family 4 protein n=1 Tax=Thermococcus sp. MAR1 TaxID=1638263 RepID=UPI00143A2D83|nr:glycosyltransferase family 4 protein [Thermococcus sp. MAR1]NJE11020.1 glycosyltransferase [Thermococcus sp. MAR1]